MISAGKKDIDHQEQYLNQKDTSVIGIVGRIISLKRINPKRKQMSKESKSQGISLIVDGESIEIKKDSRGTHYIVWRNGAYPIREDCNEVLIQLFEDIRRFRKEGQDH